MMEDEIKDLHRELMKARMERDGYASVLNRLIDQWKPSANAGEITLLIREARKLLGREFTE